MARVLDQKALPFATLKDFWANPQQSLLAAAQTRSSGEPLANLIQVPPLPDTARVLCAGLNYRDKTYSDTTNVNSVPAYVIGNAMVGWEQANWRVALNVKNITNERYFIAANGAGGLVGEGLSAFLTIAYRE